MVRNERESKKLELFQKYVADIQDALPWLRKTVRRSVGWRLRWK